MIQFITPMAADIWSRNIILLICHPYLNIYMYNFSNQPLSIGISIIRWYFPAFYGQFSFRFFPHWNMQIYGNICNQLYT